MAWARVAVKVTRARLMACRQRSEPAGTSLSAGSRVEQVVWSQKPSSENFEEHRVQVVEEPLRRA